LKKLRTVLKVSVLVLAALLVTGAGIVLWASHSESGSRSILAMSRRWLPAGLTIGEVGGTVAGTLHVRNLHYRDPALGIDLVVDDALLRVAALALLSRRLHVEDARISGARLELFEPQGPRAPPSQRDPWTAPLDMQVDALELTRGELRRPDVAPFSIVRARLSASWIGAGIEARRFELESPQGRISLRTRLSPATPRLQQLQASYDWRIGEQQWSGTLDAKGERNTLQLALALQSPTVLQARGILSRSTARAGREPWRAHVSIARFGVRPLVDTEAFSTAALELDAEGDTDALDLRGVLSLDEQRVHIEKLSVARHGELLEVAALKLRLNSQTAALTGTARLALDRQSPSSAELAWDELRLPDAWAGANFRCAGRVALTASGQRFALNSTVRLARAQRQATLALRLDGSRESLRIRELELTQLPGSLSIAGDVQLAQPLHWSLDARARQFDPSLFFESWPGALDFELVSRGQWPEKGPHADFRLTQLAGSLRQRKISGSGEVSLGPDLRPSGRIHLQSGGATLEASANAAARRVDARVAVTALEEWRPGLSGALQAELASTGRWPDVSVDATLSAQHVRQGGNSFASARLKLQAQNARAPHGSASLETQGLTLAAFSFDELRLRLEGDERAHRLQLDAQGKPLSLSLRGAGAWSKVQWSGNIEQLGVDVDQVPPLRLAQPVPLRVTRAEFELGNACLKGGEIQLCAAARLDPRSFTANYSIRALPLSVLVALAAPDAQLHVDGTLEGGGDLRRTPDGVFTGQAALKSTSGSISQREDKQAMVLEYRDFGVELELSQQLARARLHGVLPRQGEMQGAITLAMSERDPTLAGGAAIKLRDLAPMGVWAPQLANLKGSGEITAQMAGTLGAPRVGFTVRGTGLDAEIPLLGVHLREGAIDARLQPGGAFVAEGSISSGDGTLRANGTHDAGAGIALKLTGSRFLAANVPGARVTMAPDLALSGKQGALALSGAVTIEEADVNLEKLSFARARRPSTDVVVVDREVKVEEHSLGLTTDVRVILGPGVKLAGFGLDAKLGGELRVLESGEGPGRATGEIRVDGTYEAFGRKLTIERGRLQFAGTALDDPQLDILASRKLQDVTAKLRVTGTAQNPKMDVFTDPAMSQTDAMSYLLTGKPASDAHGEEGAMVQSAAQSVGSVLGNRLAKRLGGKMTFVDEIGVEQNADLGGNAFTVGKYLSPKFFISYGVGLFEPGSTMTVRYEFTRHWSLEANQTPDDGHAGIRYRIEK
jgi:translocation and assembly module TamB